MTTWPEDNISLYELYVRMDGIWVPDRLADAYCKKSLSKSEYKRCIERMNKYISLCNLFWNHTPSFVGMSWRSKVEIRTWMPTYLIAGISQWVDGFWKHAGRSCINPCQQLEDKIQSISAENNFFIRHLYLHLINKYTDVQNSNTFI